MTDHEPVQPTDDFLNAALERVRRTSQERRRDWDAWVQTQPQSQICELHQQVRTIDFDRSIYESARDKRNAVVYVACPGCAELATESATARWMLGRGVPENMLHCCYQTYRPRTEAQKLALESAKKFAHKRRGFLILTGHTKGTGKTHLGIAVMRDLGTGRFLTNSRLMQLISRRYDDRTAEDIVDACQRTPLLVLDDLGISRGGRDELPALHAILEHRHGAKLPTVLTSNLSLQDVQAYLGERLGDRLHESGFAVEVLDGESYRRTAKATYFA